MCGNPAVINYQLSHPHGRGAGVGRDLGVGVTRGLTLGVTVPVGVAVIVTSSNALPQWSASTRWNLICLIAAPTIDLPLFLTITLFRSSLGTKVW
jgi:hypothetical protein